ADGLADVVGPVRLAAEEVAVSAGHADRAPGRHDPRTGKEAVGDGATHRELDIVAPGEIPDRGHPGLDRFARPQEGFERRQRRGIVPHYPEGIRLAAEAEMHVRVDEAGQERATREIDAPAAGRPRLV